MLDLAGRIAVITGGSGALGLAVAKELNGLGAHVILHEGDPESRIGARFRGMPRRTIPYGERPCLGD